MKTFLVSLLTAAVMCMVAPKAQAACGCNIKLYACLNAAIFTGPAAAAVTIKCFDDHRKCVKACTKDDCKKECRESEDEASKICKNRAKEDKAKCKNDNKDKEKACEKQVKDNEDKCLLEADNNKRMCKLECKQEN
jgi:hypothetical protein